MVYVHDQRCKADPTHLQIHYIILTLTFWAEPLINRYIGKGRIQTLTVVPTIVSHVIIMIICKLACKGTGISQKLFHEQLLFHEL